MRVLVTGGRDYSDENHVGEVLWHLSEITPLGVKPHLVAGGAPGLDTLAALIATMFGWGVTEFPADWKRHGRAAGPIRNREMIVHGKPDYCIAFPGGIGTANCVKQCRLHNIPVIKSDRIFDLNTLEEILKHT